VTQQSVSGHELIYFDSACDVARSMLTIQQ